MNERIWTVNGAVTKIGVPRHVIEARVAVGTARERVQRRTGRWGRLKTKRSIAVPVHPINSPVPTAGPPATGSPRRRVGAPPSGLPFLAPGETASLPDNTTILGAFKVTGKTDAGLSVAALQAFTQKETVAVASPLGGREAAVEPFGSFTVGRLHKDWDKGNTTLGAMLTETHRFTSDPALSFLPTTSHPALGGFVAFFVLGGAAFFGVQHARTGPPHQPIAFNHAKHIANGVACEDCHTDVHPRAFAHGGSGRPPPGEGEARKARCTSVSVRSAAKISDRRASAVGCVKSTS